MIRYIDVAEGRFSLQDPLLDLCMHCSELQHVFQVIFCHILKAKSCVLQLKTLSCVLLHCYDDEKCRVSRDQLASRAICVLRCQSVEVARAISVINFCRFVRSEGFWRRKDLVLCAFYGSNNAMLRALYYFTICAGSDAHYELRRTRGGASQRTYHTAHHECRIRFACRYVCSYLAL